MVEMLAKANRPDASVTLTVRCMSLHARRRGAGKVTSCDNLSRERGRAHRRPVTTRRATGEKRYCESQHEENRCSSHFALDPMGVGRARCDSQPTKRPGP